MPHPPGSANDGQGLGPNQIGLLAMIVFYTKHIWCWYVYEYNTEFIYCQKYTDMVYCTNKVIKSLVAKMDWNMGTNPGGGGGGGYTPNCSFMGHLAGRG